MPGEPAPFTAVRLGEGPLLSAGMPGLAGEDGAYIGGPSLLRVPDWVASPLGRYYLYFAHHLGRYIRLATADHLAGPWTVVPGGVLPLKTTAALNHVASPDVYLDEVRQAIRLYFHGPSWIFLQRQVTYLATSGDGLHFTAAPQKLGPPYFRVFAHGGWFYALAKKGKTGLLLRSRDGMGPFEPGPEILPRMRHPAVLLDGDTLWIFYSRIGDAPESILVAPMQLKGDWRSWRPGEPSLLLAPERDYEGAGLPVAPSDRGGATVPVRQLRDPGIHVEDGRIYLFYSIAGERGIALAELRR
ncbi:MAG TPA: hypothetical protein VFE33_17745 [Thermoanaerobaculia bacterium]|nr:hypothetical protein [Thermoanaerobaculia bacterium]